MGWTLSPLTRRCRIPVPISTMVDFTSIGGGLNGWIIVDGWSSSICLHGCGITTRCTFRAFAHFFYHDTCHEKAGVPIHQVVTCQKPLFRSHSLFCQQDEARSTLRSPVPFRMRLPPLRIPRTELHVLSSEPAPVSHNTFLRSGCLRLVSKSPTFLISLHLSSMCALYLYF